MSIAEIKTKRDKTIAAAQRAFTELAYEVAIEGKRVDERQLDKLIADARCELSDFHDTVTWFESRKELADKFATLDAARDEVRQLETEREEIAKEREIALKEFEQRKQVNERLTSEAARAVNAAEAAANLLRSGCSYAESALVELGKAANEAAADHERRDNAVRVGQSELDKAIKRRDELAQLVKTRSTDHTLYGLEDNKRRLEVAKRNVSALTSRLREAEAELESSAELCRELHARRREIEAAQLTVWPQV